MRTRQDGDINSEFRPYSLWLARAVFTEGRSDSGCNPAKRASASLDPPSEFGDRLWGTLSTRPLAGSNALR